MTVCVCVTVKTCCISPKNFSPRVRRIKRVEHRWVRQFCLCNLGPVWLWQEHIEYGDLMLECVAVQLGRCLRGGGRRWEGSRPRKWARRDASWLLVSVLICIRHVSDLKHGRNPDCGSIFVVIFISCRQMPERCLELCDIRLILHSHPIILRCIVIAKTALSGIYA